MKQRLLIFVALISVLAFAGFAQALPMTFSASSGSLSASATFETSGSNLIVTLTNTSAADVTVPSDVLTAVFFTLAGDPTLTTLSAMLNSGSSVYYDPQGQPLGGVVGGEWAYRDNLSGAPLNADEGISSAGFGLFGPGDLFPGDDLAPPLSPDGSQYGLLSAGDNTDTGNGGITGSGGLIKNSAIFTLSGLSSNFDPSAAGAITDVYFQYGTAISVVPEPSTLLLLGFGLAGLPLLRRKMKR